MVLGEVFLMGSIKVKNFLIMAALLLFLPINKAHSSIYAQYSLSYMSDEDNVNEFSYSRLGNLLFIGANVDIAQRWVLGWNFYLWSRDTQSSGTTESVSLTELGPRFLIFINEDRNFYFSAAYHPYVRGTLTKNSTEEEVSGSGYIVTLGYQFKASKTIYFGASLNYQSTTLDTSTVSNVETDVSYAYTKILPMIELSIRFR